MKLIIGILITAVLGLIITCWHLKSERNLWRNGYNSLLQTFLRENKEYIKRLRNL